VQSARNTDLGFEVLTAYGDVSDVLRSPNWSVDPRQHTDAAAEAHDVPESLMVLYDPTSHRRIRNILNPIFARGSVENIRPQIEAIVDAAVSQLEPKTDLVTEFAELIALAVLAQILDIDAEVARAIRKHTAGLVKILEVGMTDNGVSESADAAFELSAVLTPVIVSRQSQPGTDLISLLVASGEVEIDEVLAACMLLLAAGFETPADTMANGILAIAGNAEHIDKLKAYPDRAVEEVLRLHGSIRFLKRTALTDQQIGDKHLKAGTTVVLDLHAANTDPARFPNAHVFTLDRVPRAHVGLGKGLHLCLGASVGRIQTTVALTKLFDSYPDLSIDTRHIVWREMKEITGIAHLPAELGSLQR
jgi:cytochrome P450